ncbi:MAG: acyltransferase [Clostridiales Family XIII bacterium]|jgi:peptidoglycan/LPS O-acetylase OafA/YrhL|nr:acyltransferase [Clostridiales Family XIII bacterium]
MKTVKNDNIKTDYIEYADGLRAICSILVVIIHYLLAFVPLGFVGYEYAINPSSVDRSEYYFKYFPYSIITNGNLVLYIFFALISFIVATKFLSNTNTKQAMSGLQKQAAKRYFRLMPPVLASILISYIVFAFGGIFSQEMGTDVNAALGISSNWTLSMYPQNLNLFGAILTGILGIFLPNGNTLYHTVTWCIYIIFIGSYLSYGFLALFGKAKNRCIFYAMFIVIGLYYQPFSVFLIFISGIMAADIIQIRKKSEKKELFGITMIILGFLISIFAPNIWFGGNGNESAVLSLSTLFIICGSSESNFAVRVLSHKFWKPISRLSFALIFTHTIILFSLSAYLFHIFYTKCNLSFPISAILTSIASVPVIVIFAVIFEKYIERPVEKFVNNLSIKLFER